MFNVSLFLHQKFQSRHEIIIYIIHYFQTSFRTGTLLRKMFQDRVLICKHGKKINKNQANKKKKNKKKKKKERKKKTTTKNNKKNNNRPTPPLDKEATTD